ncbi:MAG TPA: hypothetical protein VKA87_06950 [Nitrososphaeraceae archaeon]|nr:hypothetical protein [Nitrososphaeraceae archaeon]
MENSKKKKMVALGCKQAPSWRYQLYFILLVDCHYVMGGGVILYHEWKNAIILGLQVLIWDSQSTNSYA